MEKNDCGISVKSQASVMEMLRCESLLCGEQVLRLGTLWMSSLLPAWYSRTLRTRWLLKSDCSDKGASFTTSQRINCCCFWSRNYSTLSGSTRSVGWFAFFPVCQMCDEAVGCDAREKAKICSCGIFQRLVCVLSRPGHLGAGGWNWGSGVEFSVLTKQSDSLQSSQEFSWRAEFDFMCMTEAVYFIQHPSSQST